MFHLQKAEQENRLTTQLNKIRNSMYGSLAMIRRDNITTKFNIIQQNLGGWTDHPSVSSNLSIAAFKAFLC